MTEPAQDVVRPPAPGGGLIATSIARPVAVAVGALLILLFGIAAVGTLPIQLTPDLTVPTLTVSTAWPGATPLEVESAIVERQEEVLKTLPGLRRMTSEMRQGQGTVTLELTVGSDLEEALARVTNLLAQVPRYPASAREPVVATANAAGPPLAVIVIQADDGGPVAGWQTWLGENVVPNLDRIPGVAEVRVIGGREEELQIDFDPVALAARGLTARDLARAVTTSLGDASAGDATIGKRREVVRTTPAPVDADDFASIVLAADARGTPVLLGDVAEVRDGLRKPTGLGLADGRPSMALLLSREAGANVLAVTREIRSEVTRLAASQLAPRGLSMRIVSDQVDYIEGALALLRDNLLVGAGFTFLVLLVALRSFGASLVVSLAIPVSVVGTALGMALLGRNINLVSLSGTAFAVGMVVDNAIVVIEHIDALRRRTATAAEAALVATREVAPALVASTATTAAVFIPVLAWEDEVGDLLRDVSIAIALAVSLSLVVAVTLIPTLGARLLKPLPSAPPPPRPPMIARIVAAITGRPMLATATVILGLGAPVAAGFALMPPLEYLPTGNRNVVFGVVLPPPGTSIDEAAAIGQTIQDRLTPHLGQAVGNAPAIERTFFFGGPDSAFMGAVASDPARTDDLVGLVRKAQSGLPDVLAFASKAGLFDRRAGSGRAIEVDLLGPDQDAARAFGGRLMGALSEAIPGAQIRPIPGLDPGAPEQRVEPRRDRLAAAGLTPDDLAFLVDAHLDGAVIADLTRPGTPRRDVLLRARPSTGPSRSVLPEDLAATPVATRAGLTSLGALATVTPTLGPTVLAHIERSRALTLAVTPPAGEVLETTLVATRAVIDRLTAEGAVPPDLRIQLAGSADKLAAAVSRFADVLLLALLITYLLLAALYEDWLAPIAILVTVPLAGTGGLMALAAVDSWLGKQPLDMMTALGFVILIGTVVNNAILIVDGALSGLREGLPRPEAVARAVSGRVRPILMTTATTIAGLLPLVLFPGDGSELYRGIGAVVLGGLLFATVLTLFVVPAVFTAVEGLRGVFVRGRATRSH